LFAHFGSKEALQLRVLESAVDRFIATVLAPALRAPRGEPRLRALFENWLTWSRAECLEGGCPLVAAAIELDDRPGPVRDYLLQAQKDWLEALATAARIAIEEGHFSPDTEPEQVAHEFNSAILGYHHAARLLRDPQAEARTRRAFEAMVARAGAAPAQPESDSELIGTALGSFRSRQRTQGSAPARARRRAGGPQGTNMARPESDSN
ncbi:MAG: hypothetical protein V3T29_03140, partial [Alphaproteobacteria bacterium]